MLCLWWLIDTQVLVLEIRVDVVHVYQSASGEGLGLEASLRLVNEEVRLWSRFY